MELVLSEADKIHLTKKFAEFFKNSKNSEFIVFDLETNGLQGSEVLSISAQKCCLTRSKKIETLSFYERYYYPTKSYNWGAIQVNDLGKINVDKLRKGVTYPRFFVDDVDSFKNWCGDCTRFVGHNIKNFDCKFFPEDFDFEYVFDTMIISKPLCKLPGRYGLKNPKLTEAAIAYGVDTESGILHTSSFDVEVNARLFEAMYNSKNL